MKRDDPNPQDAGAVAVASGSFDFSRDGMPVEQGHVGSARRTPWHGSDVAAIRAVALVIADLGGLLQAATLAFLLNSAVQSPPVLRAVEKAGLYGWNWSGWSSFIALVMLGLYFATNGHYSRRVPLWLELKQVVIGTIVALMLDVAVRATVFGAVCGFETAARWLIMIPSILLARQAGQVVLRHYGLWDLRTFVIDERAARFAAGHQEVQAAIDAQFGSGYSVVVTRPLSTTAARPAEDLAAAIKGAACELVVLVMGAGDETVSRSERQVISALDRAGVAYALVPTLASHFLPMTGFNSRNFLKPGAVMLVRHHRAGRLLRRMAKSVFDRTLAALSLIVASPVFLFLLWRVRSDGGPALFGHQRIGERGVPFKCLKFRTMVPNASEVLNNLLLNDPVARAEWASRRKLTVDPRITRLGRFLRETSLDELPQLVNVLRGEMSLVGPRPIVQDEVPLYGFDYTYYCGAKPGITGLWQISGRSATTYEERVRCDVWYVQNWTVWHDMEILLKTVSIVLQRHGAI